MTYRAPPPPFTAAQRASVPLLDKYKCNVCQKFKAPSCFSKKELNKYTFKVISKMSVNAITANLRCSVCAGNVPQEMLCKGHCGLWKSLDDFSKSARKNGGSKLCKDCTSWKEGQEYGLVTAPAPNGDLAPDEEDEYNAVAVGNDDADAGVWSDPELGHGDSDYDDGGPAPSTTGCWKPTWATTPAAPATASLIAAPYKLLADLKVSGGEDSVVASSKVPSSMAANAPNSEGFVAPNARAKAYPAPNNPVQQGSTSENFNTKSQSQSSISNPYENSEGPSQVWAAVDVRRRAPVDPVGTTFNAWDPSGKHHTQLRYPSSSEPTSSRSSATATAAPLQSARNSNWAKPVGSRYPRQAPAPAPQTQYRRPARADDDSDDEM